MSNSDIKMLIEEWYYFKKKVKDIESKLDECKESVITYMERNDIDTLKTDDYIVKKYEMERENITKKDLPSDLWEKYSRKTTTKMYKINLRKD